MINPFKPGDKKVFLHLVTKDDLASFSEERAPEGSGSIHPVYSTFALARDAEWACRLFVLEMKEADEEGIGTKISVEHHSPALVGSEVKFEAELLSVKGNKVLCRFEAFVGHRMIASGEQEQAILKKEKARALFRSLKEE